MIINIILLVPLLIAESTYLHIPYKKQKKRVCFLHIERGVLRVYRFSRFSVPARNFMFCSLWGKFICSGYMCMYPLLRVKILLGLGKHLKDQACKANLHKSYPEVITGTSLCRHNARHWKKVKFSTCCVTLLIRSPCCSLAPLLCSLQVPENPRLYPNIPSPKITVSLPGKQNVLEWQPYGIILFSVVLSLVCSDFFSQKSSWLDLAKKENRKYVGETVPYIPKMEMLN